MFEAFWVGDLLIRMNSINTIAKDGVGTSQTSNGGNNLSTQDEDDIKTTNGTL